MAIHSLEKERGRATSIDIARSLNLTLDSVCATLERLTKSGYVIADGNRYRLNSKAVDVVNTVLGKRRIVHAFLRDVLGMSNLDAIADACMVEHFLSQQSIDRMTALVGVYGSHSATARQFRAQFRIALATCRPGEHCEGCQASCCFATSCDSDVSKIA